MLENHLLVVIKQFIIRHTSYLLAIFNYCLIKIILFFLILVYFF